MNRRIVDDTVEIYRDVRETLTAGRVDCRRTVLGFNDLGHVRRLRASQHGETVSCFDFASETEPLERTSQSRRIAGPCCGARTDEWLRDHSTEHVQ